MYYFLLIDSIEDKVAFSAHILGDKPMPLSLGSVVLFDQVLTNLGNGYEKNSGSFTAPIGGTYSLSIYFMADHTVQCHLGIYVNGESKCTAYAVQPLGMASCAIIEDLNLGDVVNVKIFFGNANSLHGNAGANYKHQSGFIGFLYKKA